MDPGLRHEVVDRLVVLDAAHPRKLQKGLFDPRQLLRSWHFFFFTLPWLPERVVRCHSSPPGSSSHVRSRDSLRETRKTQLCVDSAADHAAL
jgi:hypothetical protein